MAKFTGGIHTNDGNYSYHAFLSSGTLTKTAVENVDVDVLIVGGGGGAAGGRGAGGGGAGAVRWETGVLVSDNNAKTITVGAGGSGGSQGNGTSGGNSSALGYTATGGGYGARASTGGNSTNGSGGGGGGTGGAYAGGNGVTYGNDGGTGYSAGSAYDAGGGGGGAGAAGGNASHQNPGAGGAGVNHSANVGTSFGESGWFGGGGGGTTGGIGFGASGGQGGGGDGVSGANAGIAGTDGTGGGGGAGGDPWNVGPGGDGGDGIVIIRYVEVESNTEEVATGPANIDLAGLAYDLTVTPGAVNAVADGPADIAIAGKAFSVSRSGSLLGDTGLDTYADLTVNSQYSTAELHNALTSSVREVVFRYELLDGFDNPKRWLPNVESCSIEHNMFREIKRTAKLVLAEDNSVEIDYLKDRIKPYMFVKMPDGYWSAWPLGVFLLTSPQKTYDGTRTLREIEAYDKSQILSDDVQVDRYSVLEGTLYTDVIKDLLADAGITRHKILASSLTLPTTREWEPGTSKLSIINSLLSSINFKSLWFDHDGIARGERYRSLDSEPPIYTYDDTLISVMYPEANISFDLFSIPNKWVIVVSQPDVAEMVATYTNNSPDSPTSTVNRGRTIVDFRTSEAETPPTQEVLQAQVERLAESASQVYEHTEFSSSLMPIHNNQDIVRIHYPKMNIDAKFVHTGWTMDLVPGGTMNHNIRRVVVI